jgi:hypothetical protein
VYERVRGPGRSAAVPAGAREGKDTLSSLRPTNTLRLSHVAARFRRGGSLAVHRKSPRPRDIRSVGPRGSRSVGRRDSRSVGPRGSRSVGPRGSRSVGPRGSRSVGPQDMRSVGPRGSRSVGPRGSRSVGPQDIRSVGPPSPTFPGRARQFAGLGRVPHPCQGWGMDPSNRDRQGPASNQNRDRQGAAGWPMASAVGDTNRRLPLAACCQCRRTRADKPPVAPDCF